MIRSMTGYGRASASLKGGRLTVEIRSVNGKGTDIGIKSQLLPRDREMEVRKRLAGALQRGTIDLFLTWEPEGGGGCPAIDSRVALEYYSQMKDLAGDLGVKVDAGQDPIRLLSTLVRMPGVMETSRVEVINESNWAVVSGAIDKAIEALDSYRLKEGEALYKDVTGRIGTILSLYDEVEKMEPVRVAAVRERIARAAEELEVTLDKSRLEQEMVYYVEKLDINEEKVRLRQHCKYFMDTIDSEACPGRKLGFIIQEMGREINTTGSKANNADIQKLVVRMKDELEKIREQSMNIL
ncbi:MAG: YicC family protein [Bacteroidales bacterium]|nr:YicC family protein [Bacteroidales bacterium]